MIETLKKELEGDIEISVAVPCDEPPVALDEEGVDNHGSACTKGNYNYMKITSGAGHDSQVLAQAFPTNMIFVPSVRESATMKKRIYQGRRYRSRRSFSA